MESDKTLTDESLVSLNAEEKNVPVFGSYISKYFKDPKSKPAQKPEPVEIELKEMKYIDKDKLYGKKEENKSEGPVDKSLVSSQSSIKSDFGEFLDNLQELHRDLVKVKNNHRHFFNLMVFMERLLDGLIARKDPAFRRIEIIQEEYKEDNFIIMLLSLGFEMASCSEYKINLVINNEPPVEALKFALNTIRSQYMPAPQPAQEVRTEPFVIRKTEPQIISPQDKKHFDRASFLASKHEQRLQKISQQNTNVRTNYNPAPYPVNTSTTSTITTSPTYPNQATNTNILRSPMTESTTSSMTSAMKSSAQSPSYQGNRGQSQDNWTEEDQICFGLRVLELTNQFREANGLRALDWSQELYEVAMEHSKRMAEGKVALGHLGFDKRCEKLTFPRWSITENVACNTNMADPPESAVQGWIQSPAHRKNLLSNSSICGVACCRAANGTWYFTQMFALKGE